MPLDLTEKAAEKVQAALAKQNLSQGFLRLRVSSGGCSGMNYEFEITDKSLPGDIVAEAHGAKIVTDPMSYFYLNGSTVDYFQSMMRSGFEIKNPNAASTCNCGTSFST